MALDRISGAVEFAQRNGSMFFLLFLVFPALEVGAQAPYGLTERLPNNSLLIDPVAGQVPQTVSASGLFSDMATRTPAPGIIPYGVNSVLWSDGASKTRFIALPGQAQIEFSADGIWQFPPNAVLVKNFYIDLEVDNPETRHIVETRFLVKRGEAEEWDGFSYMWDLAGEDAVLLEEAATQSYFVADPEAEDGFREYVHFYPGPEDCALCHTRPAGYVLGLNTGQMNGTYDYDGLVDNQLRTLNHIGLFTEDIGEEYAGFPKWADPTDESLPLEDRGRAYLAANCSHCHRPNVVSRAILDLRHETPMEETNTIGWVPSLGMLDTEEGFVISPGDAENSTLYLRLLTFTSNRMPPVASSIIDPAGSQLIRRWIASMGQSTEVANLASTPSEPGLEQNFPNPFNPQTTIPYTVGVGGPVELSIYDALGQKVRTLVQAEQAPGQYRALWDGRTQNGELAASGAYFYRLQAGEHRETRRLVLLR